MANLGYVGLGAMGGQTADRLLSKGPTVTGYNRTRSKAEWLIHNGLKWADSPRAVCDAADVTFVMDVPLPTTATVNEFLTAARGMGLADEDFAVIFKVLARMSGLAT